MIRIPSYTVKEIRQRLGARHQIRPIIDLILIGWSKNNDEILLARGRNLSALYRATVEKFQIFRKPVVAGRRLPRDMGG